MKRIILIILVSLLFVSCGTAAYMDSDGIYSSNNAVYVLKNHYPVLYNYYMEGVLRVKSIKQVTLVDGTVNYDVKYSFIKRYYYGFDDRIEVLRYHYPELYTLYVNGVITINSIYKYVDRSTGKIRYHVSYGRAYQHYTPNHIYRERPYYRYHRPRVVPRPTPTTRPTPLQRPPQHYPNTRPNNPPKSNGGQHGGNRRK